MRGVDNAPQVHSNLDFISAPVSSQSYSLAPWLADWHNWAAVVRLYCG